MPIVKFEDTKHGLSFDISFEAANGPQTADYVQRLMQQLPQMHALTLLLKLFLQQRKLNEARVTVRRTRVLTHLARDPPCKLCHRTRVL